MVHYGKILIHNQEMLIFLEQIEEILSEGIGTVYISEIIQMIEEAGAIIHFLLLIHQILCR